MSRVQCIQQLYILDDFPKDKIYPSSAAMSELERLKRIAGNEEENNLRKNAIVLSMNIRSLLKHHKDLLTDQLAKAEVIAIQETWCDPQQSNQHLALPGYSMHFESRGHGKGIITYFKEHYQVTATVNTDSYQITKVTHADFHVVNVYCSKGAEKRRLLNDLLSLLQGSSHVIIVGDFNDNFLQNPKPKFIEDMIRQGLSQLVESPTHIEGGLLDHVYVKDASRFKTATYFRYYTDHAAIAVLKSNDNRTD